MNLCQCFNALSHDPAAGVMPFINDVLAGVHQLKAIKRKPQNDEITDKLLISLHSSFAAIHTNLSLCTPKPSIKEITTALREFEDNETFPTQIDSMIKEESLLYAYKGSCGSKPTFDDFDWGNSKGQDGICFHCSCSSHIVWKFVANMPMDVKEHILNHHAHVATEDLFSLAVTQLPANDCYGYKIFVTILFQFLFDLFTSKNI